MEITEFTEKLKECKKGKETAFIDFKCRQIHPTIFKLISAKKCKLCGSISRKILTVEFYEPIENLTVFQAGLLFSVFAENRKPLDYANYHKCIAGKEFIKNIKSVNLWRF